MDPTTVVTPADVRAFAARVCAANIIRSPNDIAEYERLRSKLFAACAGDPTGIDRISAVTRTAKACLAPGGNTRHTIARLRQAVNSLITYIA